MDKKHTQVNRVPAPESKNRNRKLISRLFLLKVETNGTTCTRERTKRRLVRSFST
jgi:hypothetical protein